MEKRTMEVKEEIYVQTEEATLENNGCGSLHQLPPCEPLRSTDAQTDDCHSADLRQLDNYVHNSATASVRV